jgi:predicted RNA-binding protein YlqC (UPF0109 family)
MIELDEMKDTGEPVESMRSLMEGIVLTLVDSRDSVVVKAVPSASEVAIVIAVAAEDLGKVIGKDGRTVRSLRTILGAASKKFGLNCSVDLRE